MSHNELSIEQHNKLFFISTGEGWKCLTWPLIKRCTLEGVRIADVKEKFGGLRFYVYVASDELYLAIDDAEELSFTICEECGDPGEPRGGSWIKTQCDECAQCRP